LPKKKHWRGTGFPLYEDNKRVVAVGIGVLEKKRKRKKAKK
jgi:hypothetical protein